MRKLPSLHLGTAVICLCLALMWLVIAYVIAQDTPRYVPADIRPNTSTSYTPFTQTPRSGGALVGQQMDTTLAGLVR